LQALNSPDRTVRASMRLTNIQLRKGSKESSGFFVMRAVSGPRCLVQVCGRSSEVVSIRDIVGLEKHCRWTLTHGNQQAQGHLAATHALETREL
jgi:hypothetical protein